MLLHATCVAIKDKGVLLTGDPGSGKSDLALRLIDEGAELVADDMTKLCIVDEHLVATAPNTIAGMMEVRHVGLLRLPHRASVTVSLYVELVSQTENLERLPEGSSFVLLDHSVPLLKLPALSASTPAKIRAALFFPPAVEES
jgi:serine kinase of HPr protein (carbohydrate metabolism regulator)